jgi:tetratricopeptide (TPR) repeat protein
MGEAFYRRGDTKKAMEYLQRALVYYGRPKLPTSRREVRLGILREVGKQLAYRFLFRLSGKNRYKPGNQVVEETTRVYEIVAIMQARSAPERFLLTTLTSLNFSEENGYLPGVVSELASLVVIAYFFSFFRLAGFFLKRTVALAKDVQHPATAIIVYMVRSISEGIIGPLTEAVEDGLRGAELARRTGYWHLNLWAYSNSFACIAYGNQGDFKTTRRLAEELVRFGQDANDPDISCTGLSYLGMTQELRGEFEESIKTLNKAIELSESIPNHVVRLFAGSELGRCYCRTGDLERGIGVLKQTGEYRAAYGVRGWDYLVPLELLTAYLAAAEQCVGQKREKCLRQARQVSRSLWSAKGYRSQLPRMMMLRGIYQWTRGKRSSGENWWKRSLRLAKDMGERYHLAMTHLEIGKRLSDRIHLKQAEEILTETGADWDLEQACRLLQSLTENNVD